MRVEAALISMSTQYHPGIARAIWIPWDHSKFMTDLRVVAAPIVGIVFWLIARLAQKAFRNLPPGPKGLPIVGDVLHITDQDWLASPQRKEEYGDTPHSNCLHKLAHIPFRRDDVCRCSWSGSPRHQQPTDRRRFTRETIEHIFRSTKLHLRRRLLNETPGSPYGTIW